MIIQLVLLGAAGMTAQAVFLREALATFRSGELTIGAILFFWMAWTAFGSGVAGKITRRMHCPATVFQSLMPWYGFLGFAGIMAVSSLPLFIRSAPGEHIPFDIQFAAAALVMAPFNSLGGFLFTLGVQALKESGTTATGKAYTAEAAGAALGGAAVALILAPLLSNTAIAAVCPAIGITSSLIPKNRISPKNLLIYFAAPVIFSLAAFFIRQEAVRYYYSGQTLLAEKDTRYGRLRATRRDEQVTLYSDASVLFSYPDPETSEHAAHLPMLASPDPKRALILGGGAGGIIDEILKYPTIEQVTCVELDPETFALARKYIDERWHDDPRVELAVSDGRAYIDRYDGQWDVITMTMPPPLSGQANRYYTRDFFLSAASKLTSEGILSFSVEGAENYVPDDLALFLACLRGTLESVFPSVLVLPGVDTRFLAGMSPGMFDRLDWRSFEDRRIARGIETIFVRDYFLKFTFSDFRTTALHERLDDVGKPPVNSDYRPVGFFLATTVQGTLDNSRLIALMTRMARTKAFFVIMAVIASITVMFTLLAGKGAMQRSVAATIVTVGMTELSLEVVAILAYQSLYGYLYGRIALLTGTYMAGLAIGGYYGMSYAGKKIGGAGALGAVQGGIALLSAAWAGLLYLHTLTAGTFNGATEALMYIFIGLAGLAGGFQFPVADSVLRGKTPHDAPKTGGLYAADLAGSSVGALLTASLIIPVFGMFRLLWFLAVFNAIIAFIVFVHARKKIGD